jgi:hypothetical protein
MPDTSVDLRTLYRGRKGQVQFVDVPALNCLTLAGRGQPGTAAFADAVEAIRAASAAARFVARRRGAELPRPLPLEAQWWVESQACGDLLAAVALGVLALGDSNEPEKSWQLMIVQPPAVDHGVFEQAVMIARKNELAAVDDVRFQRWTEGPAAQILHIGPYAEEGRSLALLHDAIEAAGHQLAGRHHEIYLTTPRRTPPERLRTLLRQPIA